MEYHPYSKQNPFVRKALFEVYSKKCAYCGDMMQPKNMHIDHILATNSKKEDDIEFNQYIDELTHNGFILDSIENYRPSCASCNLKKNNRNFSVSNLRFFHSEAQNKAEKVLALINKYKDQQISFDEFDPDYDYWEKIDFSHQKDISEAIAGYRLQPCHVSACPRLVQVEEIKEKLDIVDYVVVEGEPGCGKSITVYQAAFDLSEQGYIVYRHVNKNAEDNTYAPQSDEKKYLLIIDDAQNLPQHLLEQVISQSQKRIKLILAFTKLENNGHLYSEPIRLTNYDAVKAIAQDYKKRKHEILPIVQQFDNWVGDGMLDTPFESRIKNAATKNTPWLFNYTLRGGWHTANEQFQSIYNHNKCGLLCTIIALFQILKMDGVIDFNWLRTYIQKFDNTISWTKNDLSYLVNNKLVASLDDVRIIHIESAKSILLSFFRIADDTLKQLICGILEDGYNNHLFAEQGLLWLQNVVSSSIYNLEEQVFSESLLDSVFSHLELINDEERRGYLVWFLERMFRLHREKNGKYYFKQYENIIAQWISMSTSKNAYAYSLLINALNNERNDSLRIFVSKIDIASLLFSFSVSSVEDLYVWSKLLERIACVYTTDERAEFGELLREPLITKSQSVSENNVSTFFYSLSEMYYLNPDLILELLSSKINEFQSLWLSKPEEAIDVFGFNFMAYVCGISYFSVNKPTKKQRDFSKVFVDTLPVMPFADYVSHSLSRFWSSIFDLGRLLYRENKKKYSQIIKSLDFCALSNRTFSLWQKTNGDLHLLFCFVAYGDHKSAQSFFVANKDKIRELGVVYTEFLPEQTIELFKKGVKIRLFDEGWNDTTLNALKALYCTSTVEYKAILYSEASQFANKINNFCVLDFDNEYGITLYDIIKFIKETYPDALMEIVHLLSIEKMNKKKRSMLEDDRYNRKCKIRFNKMVNLLIDYSDDNCSDELQTLKALK